MFNTVILLGNLTRDVEIRYLQSGSAIASTGIATSKKYKTATGEQREDVMFIDLTFFGRSAEIANQYLRKGSKVMIEGTLKLEQWTAQDGTKRSKHAVTVNEMKMLDTKNAQNGQNNAQQPQGYAQTPQQPQTQVHGQPQQPQAQQTHAPQTPVQQQQQNIQYQQPQQNTQPPMPQYDANGDQIPF